MALDSKGSPAQESERTLGQLVAQATQDISTIVHKEIELARAEVTSSLRFVAKGVPMLLVAGVLALYALGLLLMAGAWGLAALGLPAWAGFLIMAVLLLVAAGVLVLVGKRALTQVNPKPERAIANAEATISTLKSAVATGSDHAKVIPATNSQISLDESPGHR